MSTAIRVEHLSKEYRLGVINHGMLYKDMQSWLSRKLGKPDPFEKIGVRFHEDQGDRFWALKDLNFEVEAGARIGIIGRNGAGKSTLLKVLSRITAPTEGVAKLRGRVTSLLEVGTGFNGELTGRENIYLNGAILGMKKREIDRKLDEIISFSEIEQYIDTPVKRYSSGMYVRLAFAVAAHLDSEILIADEVLAVGDADFQKKALGKMSELSTGQGRTVLFVSHNMAAVNSLCNKGIYLENGKIALADSLNRCIEQYLSKSFGESDIATWDGDEGNEYLRLQHVSLGTKFSRLSAAGKYERGEKIELEMRYMVHKQRADYVFCVEILNMSGTRLCEISALEAPEIDLASLMSAGSHELRLEIDTGILAEGMYFVRFDFAIRDIERITDNKPTLQFEVVNREDNNGIFIPRRANIVSPNWIWSHSSSDRGRQNVQK